MHRVHLWIAVAPLLLGCRRTPAPAANPDASMTAKPEPPRPRDAAEGMVWREAGRELRAVVTTDAAFTSVKVTVSGEKAPIDLSVGEGVKVESMHAIDVTGDGTLDLVVRIDPRAGVAWHHGRSTALFATVRGPGDAVTLEELPWSQAALGAVGKDTDLRGIVPKLRSFALPDEKLATESIVHRLAFGKPEDLRKLAAPRGIDVCEEHVGNYVPHMRRCAHHARAAIDAAALAPLSMPLTDDPAKEPPYYEVQPCTSQGGTTRCAQGTGGPAHRIYVFTGAGAGRRLVEITWSGYEAT